MDFKCVKCGSTDYIIRSKPNGTGIATGIYCASCGHWHKWLNKNERILLSEDSMSRDFDLPVFKVFYRDNNGKYKVVVDGVEYTGDWEIGNSTVIQKFGAIPKTFSQRIGHGFDGKPIFDHDIVKPVSDVIASVYGSRIEVYWDKERAGYKPFITPTLGFDGIISIGVSDVISVGNIFENPEFARKIR